LSIRAVEWAFRQQTGSAARKAVLVALADNADDNGVCWPGQEFVAAKTELTERTIRNAVKQLEADGFLSREAQFVNGLRSGTRYFLTFAERDSGRPEADSDRPERDSGPTGNKRPNRPERDSAKPSNTEPSSEPSTSTSAIFGIADAPLSHLLAALIAQNGSRRPQVGKRWADAERLLLERDKRDRSEAERLIRWCQRDEFWRANVLSMPKFREKYDTLRLQAKRGGAGLESPNGSGALRRMPGERAA